MEFREVEHGSPEYGQTVELRRGVLRLPLGLDFTEEELAAEASEIHLAGWDGDRLLACLVLVPYPDGDVKMRQVAVDPSLQRGGIGTRLVEASEKLARDRGFRRMVLNARDSAVPFYKRLDYEVDGDMFEEVTIPHWRMVKMLTGPD